MERLTKHQHFITGDKNFHLYFSEEDTSAFTKKIIDKLGKLEDIEENIGISLEILFKAMESGIYYVNNSSREISFANSLTTSLEKHKGNYCLYIGHEKAVYFKDYGKTWALTKEEIIKDQKTLESLTLSECLSKIGMSAEQFLEIFDKGIWTYDVEGNLEYWESNNIYICYGGLEYSIWKIVDYSFQHVEVCDFGKTWWIEEPKEE